MAGDAPVYPPDFLQRRYDDVWAKASARIRTGNIEIDPLLSRKEADLRRGMTLLIRPTRQIQLRVNEALERLRTIEPEQHYYHPSELHMTFLSPFTATEANGPFFARAQGYIDAVTVAVAQLKPFLLSFKGITASPSTILIRGFTDVDALNAGRDILRHELRARDLAQSLDARYLLETAHMSVVRFRQNLRDPYAFADALAHVLHADFGEMEVTAMELVDNDWYMSRDCTKCLRRYELSAP